MCGLSISAACFSKSLSDNALFTVSLYAVLAGGYITEIWDTACVWYGGKPLKAAIDTNDYVTITIGGVVTLITYQLTKQTTAKQVTS